MHITTIQGNIEELAMENMIEDGIHKDDMPDHEGEYIKSIVDKLSEINNIE